MCETYAIETTRLPIGRWAEAVEKLVAKVKPGLIHSTLTGPVLLSDFFEHPAKPRVAIRRRMSERSGGFERMG